MTDASEFAQQVRDIVAEERWIAYRRAYLALTRPLRGRPRAQNFNITLRPNLFDRIRALAKADDRSFSNMVTVLLMEALAARDVGEHRS